jgi:hypothetical protein
MTSKEKAKELFDKMWLNLPTQYGYLYCKQCALIAVDEIIKELLECGEVWMKSKIKYWQEVKQEIELL